MAQNLLGKQLVVTTPKATLSAIITETEAYTENDAASHSYQGKKTKRNISMFNQAGTVYIYFIYGMYHCLNFVTERQNVGAAVLIRGCYPIHGLNIMKENRPNARSKETLLNGPAKLVQAMNIQSTWNGLDSCSSKSPLYICDTQIPELQFKKTPRIGISKETKRLWRFVVTHKIEELLL